MTGAQRWIRPQFDAVYAIFIDLAGYIHKKMLANKCRICYSFFVTTTEISRIRDIFRCRQAIFITNTALIRFSGCRKNIANEASYNHTPRPGP